MFVSAEDHQKFCTLLSLTSAWGLILYLKRLLSPASNLFFFLFSSTFTFFFSSYYIKGRWISSKFRTAQEYLLSAAWLRTQRTYSCKWFDPPIHKILGQILKVCMVEMYLLSLLNQLKWSLSFLPEELP